MQPRRLLIFAVRVHCWLMVNSVFTRTPTSSSTKLLSSQYWWMGQVIRPHKINIYPVIKCSYICYSYLLLIIVYAKRKWSAKFL